MNANIIKAALASHPDKVSEDKREEAETKFKAISKAYEILFDNEKRSLYDAYGMSAFTSGPSVQSGQEIHVDLDDILEQMFRGYMPGMQPEGPERNRPRKSKNDERSYEVTLEDLYKGKTTRFASIKTVICDICKGSGGKPHAKQRKCSRCEGKGKRCFMKFLHE